MEKYEVNELEKQLQLKLPQFFEFLKDYHPP